MATPRKTRVAIVFGGRSSEHAISCVSAGSILGALDPDLYEVVPVGITRQGAWVLSNGDPAALAITGQRLPEITAESGRAVVLPAEDTGRAGSPVVSPKMLSSVASQGPPGSRAIQFPCPCVTST